MPRRAMSAPTWKQPSEDALVADFDNLSPVWGLLDPKDSPFGAAVAKMQAVMTITENIKDFRRQFFPT